MREAFARETELLFESVLREDRNVVDLLTADYTFLNERLARHYGIPHIYGSHYRRVRLAAELDYRRGLLGKGSFLSVTWVQNNRTSHRGRTGSVREARGCSSRRSTFTAARSCAGSAPRLRCPCSTPWCPRGPRSPAPRPLPCRVSAASGIRMERRRGTGASPGYWSPLQAGRDFVFSFITTKPLKPFRDGNHARGAVFLSGARPKRDAVTPYLAVTIDQMIADRWGRDTLLVRSGRFAVPTGRDKTLEFPFQPGHPFTQGTDRALELRETGREVAVSDSDEHREAEGRADDGDEFR